MKKRSWKKIISMSLIVALVVLVGCQALGNLDLNKTLVEAILAKSQMSKQTLALDITLDESNPDLSGDESKILKLLSHLKLNLDQVKQESYETSSVQGSIDVMNRNIPFQAFISPKLLVLKVEGAKKPLVVDLADEAVDSDSLLSLGIEKEIIEQFTKKLTNDGNLHRALFGFLVNGMPNPEGITLDNVTESVYGESLSLNHVQAKVDGSQIIPLMKKFIVNLLQDDKGLREFVSQFYDILQPVLIAILDEMDKKEAEAAANPDDDEMSGESAWFDTGFMFGSSILKGLESVLRDREMAIELFHTEIKQVLVLAMVSLQTVNEMKDPMVEQLFSNESYVKADLYLDNDGKLRKMKTEFNFVPPTEDNDGIEAIKLSFASEHWKINEPIEADKIDTTDSYSLDSISKPAEMLSILDKDSALYGLLKDDMQITKKSIVLNMYESSYTPYSMLPYIDHNITMVPARFISEQLDAEVSFNEKTQEVSVIDAANGNEIVLTLQSNQAVWNDKTVKLEGTVRNRDGTTFVPLKFIAEALGAQVQWDPDTKTITITRD